MCNNWANNPRICSFTLSLSRSLSKPFLSLSEFVIERAETHGGNVLYATFTELEKSYAKEEIYPLDLKNAVARELSKVCTFL